MNTSQYWKLRRAYSQKQKITYVLFYYHNRFLGGFKPETKDCLFIAVPGFSAQILIVQKRRMPWIVLIFSDYWNSLFNS